MRTRQKIIRKKTGAGTGPYQENNRQEQESTRNARSRIIARRADEWSFRRMTISDAVTPWARVNEKPGTVPRPGLDAVLQDELSNTRNVSESPAKSSFVSPAHELSGDDALI
jgi:hypothetical protein